MIQGICFCCRHQTRRRAVPKLNCFRCQRRLGTHFTSREHGRNLYRWMNFVARFAAAGFGARGAPGVRCGCWWWAQVGQGAEARAASWELRAGCLGGGGFVESVWPPSGCDRGDHAVAKRSTRPRESPPPRPSLHAEGLETARLSR